MVPPEYIDDFIANIKEALPPEHELQARKFYPGIKWNRKNIFIVDDDATGDRILMNFEKMKRWKKTKHKVPMMTPLTDEEMVAMIESDHANEIAEYKNDPESN